MKLATKGKGGGTEPRRSLSRRPCEASTTQLLAATSTETSGHELPNGDRFETEDRSPRNSIWGIDRDVGKYTENRSLCLPPPAREGLLVGHLMENSSGRDRLTAAYIFPRIVREERNSVASGPPLV